MAKAPKAKTKTRVKAKTTKPAQPAPVTEQTTPAPSDTTEENVPEQQQAIDAVSEAADRPAAGETRKPVDKLKKDQEIEIRVKVPGMVPQVTRRIRYADLRNGALSDKTVRGMLSELSAQF